MHQFSEPYSPNRSRSKAEFASKLGHFRALLIRRWWLLVLALAVTFAVDFALRWFSPATYFSIGRMIVSIKLSIPESSVYSEEMGSFLGTQAALMQSSAVLNRAQSRVLAEHPTFTNEPVQLKVNVTPRTSIFVLEASGAEPRFVQAFLQAAMQEYVALKKEM